MKLKKILLSFATVLFSGVSWFLFAQIFKSANILDGKGLVWVLFILCIAITYGFLFLVSLFKERFAFELASFVSVLWILVFLGISTTTLLSAAGLFVAGQVLLEFPSALERSLNIRYFAVSYAKIGLVIIALLGISAVYFQDKISSNFDQAQISQQTSNYAWPFISKYLEEFNSSETVDQYLRDQIQQQGIQNPSQQMVNEQRQSIQQQLGFPVSGMQKMSDLGKKFLAARVNDILSQYHIEKSGLYLIFLSMLILWPFGRFWFALIAMIMYKISKAAGLLKETEAQIITKSVQF